MKAVSGSRASFEPALLAQLGRFRHGVFVKHLKWDLPMVSANDEFEWDEFDRADAVYVVLRGRDGDVRACARLLATTAPYLMHKLLPDAQPEAPDPRVWELSRVAVAQRAALEAAEAGDGRDAMQTLLAAVIEAARARGISRLIGVAAPAMMRLYRKKGFRLVPEGKTFVLAGESLMRFSLHVFDGRAGKCARLAG
ncbi:acyl-homoserine-lactone synthase [Burkholderia plantarii]|uniref:acyl-homoserine-lactone synthase n=1 Tax=Burkholderia plantarii TaxID=41899 RepID=UPI0018DBF66A|nr:acyl-homoserine-lactone synthase [Burkholderia plantarii]MBI0326079.1 acyl-homoserine-lactone synthase [Burkholderia plantarii]